MKIINEFRELQLEVIKLKKRLSKQASYLKRASVTGILKEERHLGMGYYSRSYLEAAEAVELILDHLELEVEQVYVKEQKYLVLKPTPEDTPTSDIPASP